jgi:hypothetical protein
MVRHVVDQERLFQVAAMCQEAILAQRTREARQGYGLDDYTEGRIVGGASLARKILRVLSGGQPDAASLGPRKRITRGR